MFIIASYCDEESQKAGASPPQIKAGKAFAERAYNDLTGIDWEIVEVTRSKEYYPWIRLKDAKATYRAIVEITPTEVILHVIVPRDANTYYSVEDLWLKYRRLRQDLPPTS